MFSSTQRRSSESEAWTKKWSEFNRVGSSPAYLKLILQTRLQAGEKGHILIPKSACWELRSVTKAASPSCGKSPYTSRRSGARGKMGANSLLPQGGCSPTWKRLCMTKTGCPFQVNRLPQG